MIIFEQVKELAQWVVNSLNRVVPVFGIGNPYKQFSLTIADGATETIFYQFNFFNILELSNEVGVTIRFGSSGTPTDVVSAGIAYEMPASVDRVQIINRSGGPITITVAMAMGRIVDNRLTVSGAVNISQPTQFVSMPAATLVNGAAAAVLMAANSARVEAFITNTDTTNAIYVGDAGVDDTTFEGVRIPPLTTAILNTTAAIYGINNTGANITVALGYTGA